MTDTTIDTNSDADSDPQISPKRSRIRRFPIPLLLILASTLAVSDAHAAGTFSLHGPWPSTADLALKVSDANAKVIRVKAMSPEPAAKPIIPRHS